MTGRSHHQHISNNITKNESLETPHARLTAKEFPPFVVVAEHWFLPILVTEKSVNNNSFAALFGGDWTFLEVAMRCAALSRKKPKDAIFYSLFFLLTRFDG